MPEKPLTIATYAAGASLAAITLVYVFGPTYFLDDEAAQSSKSGRKKGVVGLSNPMNDCFINSVLQALAGLPELRVYLIRELHRRRLDGEETYRDISAALEAEAKKDSAKTPEWKLLSLQRGQVTAGLKEILDALNERPIYKKTISAQLFIRVVEDAFRTRVSRQQQDAQEFLQIVTERIADEYHAGRSVRARARRKQALESKLQVPDIQDELERSEETIKPPKSSAGLASVEHLENGSVKDSKMDSPDDASVRSARGDFASGSDETIGTEEEAPDFPFEGNLESQVECSYCHFKPRPMTSSFVTLTLHVPQQGGSTTLNQCLDGMLKVEHIDDFKCDRCRLEHALQVNGRQLSKTSLSQDERSSLETDKGKIETALREDPERMPEGVKLPELSSVPKRRITRHMRMSKFPRILAIHLSRSVWDSSSSSAKNMAKVAFPENLPLGGLLDRKNYRLLGVVTHKGGHNSGHYESFRRQVLNPPFSTPTSMGTEGVYSLRPTPTATPRESAAPSPRLSAVEKRVPPSDSLSKQESSPSLAPSASTSSSHSVRTTTSDRRRPPPATSTPLDAIPTPGLPTPPLERAGTPINETPPPPPPPQQTRKRDSLNLSRAMSSRRDKKVHDRWWRISDDKVKESKTSEVLGMQREVYLLFYEVVDG